jgi:hypothetical protein
MYRNLKLPVFLMLVFFSGINIFADNFNIYSDGKLVPLVIVSETKSPVEMAVKLLSEDFQTIIGQKPDVVIDNSGYIAAKPCIIVGTLGENRNFDRFLVKNKIQTSSIKDFAEAFRIQVINSGNVKCLLVLGSDRHGTAYGLMELSRFIGVSPWVWWADATPEKKTNLVFPVDKVITDHPSVRYRGIFINDEDWGLMPWATKTLCPDSPKGVIGPEAYERVCQLLMRLRANLLWPAMHKCTKPFYLVPGNAEVAAKYGIYIGTSHCEPLLCNIAGEWNTKLYGEYNYKTNADSILAYWKARVEKTKDSPAIYTIGIRGEHDGKMQGAETIDEQRVLLQQVISDQRQALKKIVKRPLAEIPQVFVPYKEILDVYDSGLNVPEDITLIWCDDNYGYLTRLNNQKEALREGGSGVYYHVSYWGRPHDYLWLASTTPALVNFEMTRAWNNGAKKLWVCNVGDIKPAEYLTEYFLDLAWSADKPVENAKVQDLWETPYAKHLNNFFAREFGAEYSKELSDVMQQYYLLATQRKPEHMAWTRVEEPAFPKGMTPLIDSEFNRKEAIDRIEAYTKLENRVRTIEERIPGFKRASFFQLVAYPVYGASLLNQKLLYAQLSRQLYGKDSITSSEYAAASRFAYDEIERLTTYYNKNMSDGKWNQMMDSHPRDLFVFGEPVLPDAFRNITPKPLLTPRVILRSSENDENHISLDASWYTSDKVSGLGHSGTAVPLKKGESLVCTFETTTEGPAELSLYTLPDHAVDGGDLRYQIEFDGSAPVVFNTRTFGRSEEWKQNVLRNQTIRKIPLQLVKTGRHTLTITALDDDVVMDQILLDFNPERKFYLVR